MVLCVVFIAWWWPVGRAEICSIPCYEIKDKLCLMVNVHIVYWKQHSRIVLAKMVTKFSYRRCVATMWRKEPMNERKEKKKKIKLVCSLNCVSIQKWMHLKPLFITKKAEHLEQNITTVISVVYSMPSPYWSNSRFGIYCSDKLCVKMQTKLGNIISALPCYRLVNCIV
jgi:hypothetical protein